MNPSERLMKLATRFERKLVFGQVSEDALLDTTSFFFGKETNMRAFQQNLGNLSVENNRAVGTGSLAMLLADFWNKTNQSAFIKVFCRVDPGKSANWIVEIAPQSMVQPAMDELNKQYENVTGRTWSQGQADAEKRVKTVNAIQGDFTRVVVNMEI